MRSKIKNDLIESDGIITLTNTYKRNEFVNAKQMVSKEVVYTDAKNINELSHSEEDGIETTVIEFMDFNYIVKLLLVEEESILKYFGSSFWTIKDIQLLAKDKNDKRTVKLIAKTILEIKKQSEERLCYHTINFATQNFDIIDTKHRKSSKDGVYTLARRKSKC